MNGIKFTSQSFDSNNRAVEYDFKLYVEKKVIGVSVKRTLRERYKQNHENVESLEVDAMILITLGIDLNEDKVNYITSKKGHFIFVASDIFEKSSFLKRENKVYPLNELSNNLLLTILSS